MPAKAKKTPLLGAKIKFDNKLLLIIIAAVILVCGIVYFAATRAATSNLIPVYRLYNQRVGNHFWTASASERDKVKAIRDSRGYVWKYEGVAFYEINPSVSPGYSWSNVVRIRRPRDSAHAFSATPEETRRLEREGFTAIEGVAWKHPNGSGKYRAGVYKLVNPNNGFYMYTISTSERDNLTRAGWRYLGVNFNAYTTGNWCGNVNTCP